ARPGSATLPATAKFAHFPAAAVLSHFATPEFTVVAKLSAATPLELMAAVATPLELTPAELAMAMGPPAVPTHAAAPAEAAPPCVAAPVKTGAMPAVVVPAVSPAMPPEHLHVLHRIDGADRGAHRTGSTERCCCCAIRDDAA